MGMGEEEEEKKAVGFFSYEDGWVFDNGEEEEIGVLQMGLFGNMVSVILFWVKISLRVIK